VLGHQTGKFWMAGGGEAQAVMRVAAEEPADGPVAEAALAVKDYQQAAVELGKFAHWVWDGLLGAWDSLLVGLLYLFRGDLWASWGMAARGSCNRGLKDFFRVG